MAPARKDQAYVPTMLMDLRESSGSVEGKELDGEDHNLRAAEILADAAALPLIAVWFRAGQRVTDETNFKVYTRVSGEWSAGTVVSSRNFHETFFPGSGGAGKPINRRAANVYHEWQRSVLPDIYVFQDLDVIVMQGEVGVDWRPSALLEHKQSSMLPEEWNRRDFMRRETENYRALISLAEKARILPCTIYHCYNRPVNDGAPIGVFRITGVRGLSVSRTSNYCTVGQFVEDPWRFL